MKSSTIVEKYPTYRDDFFTSTHKWLEGKRLDDNAEGLWRIHDKLYDLDNFINTHPGGRDWLVITKGIDITEQFEAHHIADHAEKLLPNFYVRDAALPRNYKITFHENGFYRTLKRRIASKMSQVSTSSVATSRFYCDLMLASTILAFILVSRDYNYVTLLIAAFCLLALTVIAHNFIHQRDNWRMYLINFSMQNYREWRVFHAMSHHLYPNSYSDLECTFFEPFLNWIPAKKSSLGKITSIVITPLIYSTIYPMIFVSRIVDSVRYKIALHWDDLLPFMMPLVMYIFGNSSILDSFKIWFSVVLCASFLYGCMAINGGHHHNKIFHDGDELQSMDFGVYQLAATFDRTDSLHNHFFTLTTFGQHVCHHMFPTFDHSLLSPLNEILYDTCKEFEAELCIYPWYKLFIGQFKQLTRTETHKIMR